MPAPHPSPRPRAPESPSAAKAALRARILAARANRDADGAAPAARGLAARGLELADGHACVALYASAGREPDTWPLIASLHARGVRVLLPVLAGRLSPDWAWYTGPDALRPGWHEILEPTTSPLGSGGLAAASLVVCSALAVSPRGDRLGTGGGWYDRALEFVAPGAALAAVCFDAEVLDAVPTDPWDVRVGVLVTPTRVLEASNKR